ncbi:MAG: hypothetical protein U0840_03870 [Gemmataceae bacterium]
MSAPPSLLATWVDALEGILPPPGSRIALPACADRSGSDLDRLADTDLHVIAVRLQGDLTAPAASPRREQVRHLQRQLADAALLGAHAAWLDTPAPTLPHIAEALELLDTFALARRVILIVNPVRDSAGWLVLPTTAGTFHVVGVP